jgi:medium-chain acyl-[acyl-carrier-protein] hydrolase
MKPQSNLRHINRYVVTSPDTDMFGRLRPGALVNFLIQSATLSADSLGFGYGGIRKQKLFWVLSRLTVEIEKPLRWKEILEIETWPKDIDGLLYLRDFFLRDGEGNQIGRATSGWIAIDFDTKRPGRVEGLDAERFTELKNIKSFSESPVKLKKRQGIASLEILTGYYDIDLNKHVTSARYVDWMMDSFTVDFHEKNYPKRLVVNYLKETMPGEILAYEKSAVEENGYQFEAFNKSRSLTAFRGQLTF